MSEKKQNIDSSNFQKGLKDGDGKLKNLDSSRFQKGLKSDSDHGASNESSREMEKHQEQEMSM